MSGHGWVKPLPGGAKARCGGPAICQECKREAGILPGRTDVGPTKPPPVAQDESARWRARFEQLADDVLVALAAHGVATPEETYRSAPVLARGDIDRALLTLKRQKDGAYAERNQVVALLARTALALGWLVGTGQHVGADWEDDWRTLLFINIPGIGQVSWHFHDSERHLLEGLLAYPAGWDGHDTAEKYRRVNAALRCAP